ncbi:MAG: hypothetical protein HKN90_01420 [Flavobacteriaceae bacterium]|nr:hypothetical protein [Flavobacteriaceae bacterium]
MKKIFLLLIILYTPLGIAQEATEVYMFDFVVNDSLNNYKLENPVNISENAGVYDNQPSFLLDGSGILFASTRNNQTDVALFDIEKQSKSWLTNTLGSEYSPIQSPLNKYFSAIKLEEDGTQLLWIYRFNRKKPKVLVEDWRVGYHAWLNKKMVVSFILNDPPTLEVTNLKFKIKYPIEKNIGRSIHTIPNSELISFISHEHEDYEIYSINPLNSQKEYIADALQDSQDMAWTPDGTILMGKDDKLYRFKPKEDKDWVEIASIKEFDLNGISRLAVSPLGTKIVIVVNEKIEGTANGEN